jgi:hypothetical protein
MNALAAAQMVALWDLGAADPVTAAGVLLRAAGDDSADGMHGMTLGQRDARLLDLRCGTFGPTVKGLVVCPVCGQRLSLAVDRSQLSREPPGEVAVGATVVVEVGDLRVEARLPDGTALQAAAACADVETARRALVGHCIVKAWTGAGPWPVDWLDADVLAAVGDALVAADPQSEVRLGLVCAACGHQWPATFDVASFLWAEVSTMAVRLLDEVHVLASAYGWSEDQVLALSSRRRRHYLERAVSG